MKQFSVFKSKTPKAIWDITRHPETQRILFSRKVDHVINGHVYHPTKGWRKVRKDYQHNLLNSLLANFK